MAWLIAILFCCCCLSISTSAKKDWSQLFLDVSATCWADKTAVIWLHEQTGFTSCYGARSCLQAQNTASGWCYFNLFKQIPLSLEVASSKSCLFIWNPRSVTVFSLCPALFLGHQDPHILEITKMTLFFRILLCFPNTSSPVASVHYFLFFFNEFFSLLGHSLSWSMK